MNLLRRGAWAGLAFGVAAALAETSFQLLGAVFARIAPPPFRLAQGAALEIGLLVVLGVALAPLLRLRGGRVWHLVAIALGWGALQFAMILDSPISALPSYAGAPLAFVLTGLGLWIARWRPAVPRTLGVVLLVGACFAPSLYVSLRSPEPPVRADRGVAPSDAPDVVLIVLDTVRAENMSAYGYARPTSPVFDQLSTEGALYLDATSPSTWSLASHASLFTGLFPSSHGAHAEHMTLDVESPTLAEALEAAGYDTSCFTSNAFISPALGLTRGFQRMDEAWREGGAGNTFHFAFRLLDRLGFGAADKGGAKVVASFERWAEETPGDGPPNFVFLNFIEAHFPYHQLPEEYLERFSQSSRAELTTLSMELMEAQFGGDAPADQQEATRLATDMYDGGILYTDTLLGRIVEALRRRGRLDQTLLIVMSDHGELLGEHGSYGHGSSLYEPGIRVPLLLRYPARVPAGTRVATPVSTVGVYATVLDVIGIEPARALHVTSLLGPMAGGPPGGPVLAERFSRPQMPAGDDPVQDPTVRVRTYRAGHMKLVETSGGAERLFDLRADPHETHDLAREQPAELARLQGELDTWSAALALPPLDATVAPGAEPDLDPEARERLRALGYVD